MLVARLFAALFSLAVAASAAPLYVNGLPTESSGNEMTSYIVAEDFALENSAIVTGARFWGFYFGDIGRGYLGNISWQIYDNQGTEPGNVLFSGNGVPVLSAGASNCCDGIALQLDLALPDISLAAGSYWIGLHNGPLSETTEEYFYWQTSSNNTTVRGMGQAVPFGNDWITSNLEHAFEIAGSVSQSGNATPEPSTWVLVGAGIAFGWAKRSTLRSR